MSRSAFASQRPRPRTVCWRHGPGSPAASARIQPVLRRSSLSRPSRNRPADTAARSCANSGRIRAFTSRSEDAQSSSVVSIDAPAIHDSPNHGDPSIQRSGDSATVMLTSFVSVAGAVAYYTLLSLVPLLILVLMVLSQVSAEDRLIPTFQEYL